jgi:hypothetical protein
LQQPHCFFQIFTAGKVGSLNIGLGCFAELFSDPVLDFAVHSASFLQFRQQYIIEIKKVLEIFDHYGVFSPLSAAIHQ